jgi:hypothetical protein
MVHTYNGKMAYRYTYTDQDTGQGALGDDFAAIYSTRQGVSGIWGMYLPTGKRKKIPLDGVTSVTGFRWTR